MVMYVYKIQWWFDNPKDAYKAIRLLGARSFDVINLRDKMSGKIIDSYNGFLQHPNGVADDVTIRYLQRQLKKYNYAIELLRR